MSRSATRIPGTGLVLGYALVFALASAWAPVASYAFGLATAGILHVFVEFRYVEERFGARLEPRLFGALVFLLSAIALTRLLGVAGMEGLPHGLELWLGLGLLVVVLPLALKRGGPARWIGVAASLVLAVGVAVAPLLTFVLLALLHNLTPVGFLAERLRGRERRRALVLCALLFVGVPGLFLLGLPDALAGLLGSEALATRWPAPAPATEHLGVYVPTGVSPEVAIRLFGAAAFLQWMHYGAVLHVLPRLGAGDDALASRIRWGDPRQWRVPLALVAVAFLALFLWRFGTGRAVYGIFAAVHAWIELPLLILALPGPTRESIAT